ncbi:hypothetical protein NW762_010562 [Fusarium torreyae]|uniref:Uncharacterized protein n=1 Tax=Fusarium torreyae TaxID=1237075 RepID=A0A9W8VDH5_9HYPO|nr:hypothetical protein NW762_010562 [Fusarium torreyae]
MRVSDARNFFALRYLQARYFKNRQSFEAATRQAALFNVLRRLDEDKYRTALLDADGACVALVRSKASFWFQTAEPGKNGTIGILLVDPMITAGYPLWAAQPNFEDPPSMFHVHPFEAPPKSFLDSVIYWTRRMPRADLASISTNPVVMASGMAHLVCAEWLRLCRYIPTRLEQVEWEIQNPDFRLDPNGINSSLSRLYPWRRWLPLYRTMLAETSLKLFRGCSLALNTSHSNLQQDFYAIETMIDELQQRIDKIVAVITAIISIEESRRAITQNQHIGRLTYLAMIFAPLSFISSFFSMATDLTALRDTFWVYFCFALPISLIVFLLVNRELVQSWYTTFKRWSGSRGSY